MSRKSNNTFTFRNRNPKNLLRAADCVARAISLATGETWEDVVMSITTFALPMGRVFNEKEAYTKWLEHKGWQKQPMPRKSNGSKYTVREFAKLYPKGMYLVNVARHVTVVEDGIIYDTWDCGSRTVGNFYTK